MDLNRLDLEDYLQDMILIGLDRIMRDRTDRILGTTARLSRPTRKLTILDRALLGKARPTRISAPPRLTTACIIKKTSQS
jgi:hypothetical protein